MSPSARGQIHLGFEVGSGEPISIPLRHLAVTGQTQESGKTTTLEALVDRSGATALAFVTKRGERAFESGRRVQPYFRDRADWQFVTSIIDATLQEKNKFLRPWIMKICRTTRTLADVQTAIRDALRTAKGINEGVYTQLDAYLDLIVPEIQRTSLARTLDLAPGLNVMDVSSSPTPMQMLFVQSAIDYINEHARDTVVIVPEAWEFIPEGKGSPVKSSAVTLVRKGAALGNYIWVDSQDMAGVDKTILRGCAVWLIGVQREANEIKRNLSNIPASIKKPSAATVATLEKGQFFACWGQHAIMTYVQPKWMEAEDAQAISLGEDRPLALVPSIIHPRAIKSPPSEEPSVTEAEARELREENARLRRSLEALESKGARAEASSERVTESAVSTSASADAVYQDFRRRILAEPAVLRVLAQKPSIRVEIERPVIEVDGSTLRGRMALLISEGFFDERCTGNAAYVEMGRRAFTTAKPNVYRELDKLALQGFLTKEEGGYQSVEGMKINIVER